ncbi:hypothetical protein ACJ73_00517 [Blastomyces percursus]|uniref:Uncharacterized protein n=1 Tax=Blastomyces percursus TaxID=1658174 RepID=A0A1J9QJ22_9EURO|nr:hypothetical protein ACJ73_00517 [Blastomyces percursus]
MEAGSPDRRIFAHCLWVKSPRKSESFLRSFLKPTIQYEPPDMESQNIHTNFRGPAHWIHAPRYGGTLSKPAAPDAKSRTSAAQKFIRCRFC